jgi:hypothetical protein
MPYSLDYSEKQWLPIHSDRLQLWTSRTEPPELVIVRPPEWCGMHTQLPGSRSGFVCLTHCEAAVRDGRHKWQPLDLVLTSASGARECETEPA